MVLDHVLLCASVMLFFLNSVHVLDNGLALTPPMGWMSWGYYECAVDCDKNPDKCLNESLITTVADVMYTQGYIEAGYEYIIIDDCWSEMEREDGRLVPDHTRFPRGMKFLADYIHARGLKFGLYTNVGPTTCKGYPASLEYMKVDAETFEAWDVDYLKVDGCYVGEDVLNHAYKDLGYYLNRTGRPMVYSCSWPYYIKFIYRHEPDFKSISSHCNLWRDYHDIFPHWNSVQSTIKHYESQHDLMMGFHGPGKWFDPDMLLVGRNILTNGQNRIQMAVYSMLSTPLLISCDMTRITPSEKDILLNMDLLSIAQDRLGIPAKPYKLTKTITLWVKPHHPLKGDKYPSYSFAFVNMGKHSGKAAVNIREYGLNSTDGYSVYDIFMKKYTSNKTIEDYLTAIVPSFDVVLYSLFAL